MIVSPFPSTASVAPLATAVWIGGGRRLPSPATVVLHTDGRNCAAASRIGKRPPACATTMPVAKPAAAARPTSATTGDVTAELKIVSVSVVASDHTPVTAAPRSMTAPSL